MKMPEGWVNLKECVDSIKVESDNPNYIHESAIAQKVVYDTWDKPLRLLKEMAETLDELSNAPIRFQDERISWCEVQMDKDALKDAHSILKKFREWK